LWLLMLYTRGMSTLKTILLIEDDRDLNTGLTCDLEMEHYRVRSAFTLADGQRILDSEAPDLILLDGNLPDGDGFAFCRKVRSQYDIPVIFLTARDMEQEEMQGFDCGAVDYITKPFSLNELTARVAAHLRRDERGKNKPNILTSNELLVNLSERTVFYNGTEIPFSKREFELIEFLITNANQVFDRERIYERVWGYEAEGDSGVVKEHIRKIRSKLHTITGNDYIETVWGVGYKWNR